MYFHKSVFELQKTHEVQIRKYTARACVAGQGRVYPAVAAGHYYTRYEESYIHGSTVGTELRDATYTTRLLRPITPASSIGVNTARPIPAACPDGLRALCFQ